MTRSAHPARPGGGGLCGQPETGLKLFDGPDHTCLFPVCCVQVRFSHCLVPYEGLVACGSCACPAPPRGRLLCWAAVFDDLSTLFARETFTDGLCQSSSVFVTTFFFDGLKHQPLRGGSRGVGGFGDQSKTGLKLSQVPGTAKFCTRYRLKAFPSLTMEPAGQRSHPTKTNPSQSRRAATPHRRCTAMWCSVRSKHILNSR